MTTFTTTSEKERRIEDMIECLRTKMDYDEFRDLAPHLGVKLQNGYYEQFAKAEKEDGTPVKAALFFWLKDITPNSVDNAKEFFATLLWKGGEAEARGDDTAANAYGVIYDALLRLYRENMLDDAFTYAYDEESWAKNVDGRVYWVKKIRTIAEQLAKEEAAFAMPL